MEYDEQLAHLVVYPPQFWTRNIGPFLWPGGRSRRLYAPILRIGVTPIVRSAKRRAFGRLHRGNTTMVRKICSGSRLQHHQQLSKSSNQAALFTLL